MSLCRTAFAVLVVAYDASNEFLVALNQFMSYRLSYSAAALDNYGVSLFGASIDWETTQVVDCSYFRMMFDNGLIAALLIIVALTHVSRVALRRGDYILVIVLSIYALEATFDPILTTVYLFPFLLLMANSEFLGKHRRELVGTRGAVSIACSGY